jgi:hypothetical protein
LERDAAIKVLLGRLCGLIAAWLLLMIFNEASSIMQLSVKFREGFKNDTVVLRANGDLVYRRPNVSTDLSISFADQVAVPVETENVRLALSINGKQPIIKEVDARKTPFVEIWIVDGKVEFRCMAQELPMM